MRIEKETNYIAEDGTKWTSEKGCLEYEKLCRLDKLLDEQQCFEVYYRVDKVSESPRMAFSQKVLTLFEKFQESEKRRNG